METPDKKSRIFIMAEERTKSIGNSDTSPLLEVVAESIEAAAVFEVPDPILPGHSLVEDLGFDSLTITVLALEIETRLGQSILLNRWVEGVSDPSELTVGSLCAYLETLP
jgi:acyl carrier protein